MHHIIQVDPEDRTTYVFEMGNLVRKDLEQLWLDADRRYPPFNSSELLSRLDQE